MTNAHFHLVSPTARGFNADKMPTFPCGDLAQMTDRTKLPLSGSLPIALKLGHTQTAISVFLGLGNDPETNYNITLHPTFGVQGSGAFCLADVHYDSDILGVDIFNGMNATLQVQTNGDPQGGLYACADIQFVTNATLVESSSCTNDTKLQAVDFTGDSAKRAANISTAAGAAQGSGSSSKDNGGKVLELSLGSIFSAALLGAFALI